MVWEVAQTFLHHEQENASSTKKVGLRAGVNRSTIPHPDIQLGLFVARKNGKGYRVRCCYRSPVFADLTEEQRKNDKYRNTDAAEQPKFSNMDKSFVRQCEEQRRE